MAVVVPPKANSLPLPRKRKQYHVKRSKRHAKTCWECGFVTSTEMNVTRSISPGNYKTRKCLPQARSTRSVVPLGSLGLMAILGSSELCERRTGCFVCGVAPQARGARRSSGVVTVGVTCFCLAVTGTHCATSACACVRHKAVGQE